MTPYDHTMLALTIWREARSEPEDARLGVMHVILNRVAQSPKEGWPNTIHAVCVQPYQFSSFNKGDPNSIVWPLEKNKEDWEAWEEILAMIDAAEEDPTEGANFYHDDSISPPYKAWLGDKATEEDLLAKKTTDIGALQFYKV